MKTLVVGPIVYDLEISFITTALTNAFKHLDITPSSIILIRKDTNENIVGRAVTLYAKNANIEVQKIYGPGPIFDDNGTPRFDSLALTKRNKRALNAAQASVIFYMPGFSMLNYFMNRSVAKGIPTYIFNLELSLGDAYTQKDLKKDNRSLDKDNKSDGRIVVFRTLEEWVERQNERTDSSTKGNTGRLAQQETKASDCEGDTDTSNFGC
jgi:hypothetical protein